MSKYISYEPINIQHIVAEAHHDKAGAQVIFLGDVRNHHKGQSVDYLEYEAHEVLAEESIAGILNDAKSKFDLHEAVCQHRVGKVEIAQTAVIVVTAASHRKEAYAANQYIIDRVKYEAPIWKKEFFSDGSSEWGANSEIQNSAD